MAIGLITKRAVDGVVAGAATTFLWDTEVKGFGLKVTPAASRSYVYQYRMGGRGSPAKRFAIGAHGAWTPDAARKEARRLAQLVDTGTDPATEKHRTRRFTVELAFSEYAERFISDYLVPHWVGGHELAAGILRRDVIPKLARKSLPEITRVDITSLLDKLADKPATRRNAFTVLRRLFRWAVNRGDLSTSPLQDMDGPPAPASRDRVLTDDELAKVWAASHRAGYPFGPFIKTLILTGQRREEVAGLGWRELDRVKRLWSLPAARAKNGVVHDIPLSDDMVALLDGIAPNADPASPERRWPNDGLVFSTKEGKHVTGYSKAKIRIDTLIATATSKEREVSALMAPWRFHDLRRTLATGLQRLGVRFEVTEAVLNHISGSRSGIAGVYQRHNWQAEKRAALSDWSAHVIALSA